MSMIKQAAAQMALEKEVCARLDDSMRPRDAVQALLDTGATGDALKLLARLLPRRYVVAWVCQCTRGEQLSMEDRAGVSLAEKWVRDPVEENRRAAFEFANAGEYESLGAWIAATAGWASGSLAPAKQETPVPPPEHLSASAAVAAINLLAALVPEEVAERRNDFIGRAMDLLDTNKAPKGPLQGRQA